MEEAKQQAMQSIEGKTIVYVAMGHEWRPFGNPLRQRPLCSVYLPDQLDQAILNDVQEFLSCQKWSAILVPTLSYLCFANQDLKYI